MIPDGVVAIADHAFADCVTLQSVVLPTGCNNIGDNAFSGCSYLDEITLNDDLSSIGAFAFLGTLITDLHLPSSLSDDMTGIVSSYSKIKNFVIPDNNPYYRSIDGVLFSKDGKTLIAFPSGRKEVYTVPDGTESINYFAFGGCMDLEGVLLPRTVRQIEPYGFFQCSSLLDIIIPESTISIGQNAFAYCSGLKSITISDKVELIDIDAFSDCPALKDINNQGSEEKWDNIQLFAEIPSGCRINYGVS